MPRNLDQIVVIDIESCCWRGNPPLGQMNEIIEVGLALIDTPSLEIINRESYMIRPQHSEISDFCTQLTGITKDMVKDGKDFKKVCNLIQNNYGTQQRIWASFGEYDKKHFRKMCSVFNAEYPFSDMHWNIKTMASIFYGWPEMGMDKLLKKIGMKLEGEHHRGVDDAYNIAKILIGILEKGRKK